MKEINMDNPENTEEEVVEQDKIRDDIVEHVHMFTLFLLALNEMGEDDALYVRDALFEMLTPEEDRAICVNCGGRKDTDPNAN